VACRKRYVEEPGKPRVAPYRREGRRYTDIEARKGNPETGLGWNLTFKAVDAMTQDIRRLRHEGETWRRNWAGLRCYGCKTTDKVGGNSISTRGVLSSIVLRGGESPLQGEGLDGST
jgi:hypothetical protein